MKPKTTMKVMDFSHSFITFSIDSLKKQPLTVSHRPLITLNHSRKPIDCGLIVMSFSGKSSEQFLLVPSCKTEILAAREDIWTKPNADFILVFSKDKFLALKTYAFIGQEKEVKFYPSTGGIQPDRQIGMIKESFDQLQVNLVHVEGVTLNSYEEIHNAVVMNKPLVGRTRIELNEYVAVLEYPVKTINIGEREKFYQTDTGPILLPDLTRDFQDLISGLELAYCTFNRTDYTEFIVRTPTKVGPNQFVYHYSKTMSFYGRNEIIQTDLNQ